jgi:hypothetical protein
MQVEATRSVLELAELEAGNLKNNLELLGDTYDLTTHLESLYDALPHRCKFPLDVETNNAGHAAGINAHLMLLCRRELTTGMLMLLRGYRIDALFHLRRAIELCTYAAKMERHPAMSRTWLQAGESVENWEKFRDKFKKLFPEDDEELKRLYPAHDVASESMHSSVKAVAHYLSGKNRSEGFPAIGLFDIHSDTVLVASYIWIIDCHITILTKFEKVLAPYCPTLASWSQELYDAKVAFTAKYNQWLPQIQSFIEGA